MDYVLDIGPTGPNLLLFYVWLLKWQSGLIIPGLIFLSFYMGYYIIPVGGEIERDGEGVRY